MAEPRRFLGVDLSATGLSWEHRLNERQEAAGLLISQTHGTPDIVARVLAARGVSAERVAQFLDPKLRDLLPDPNGMTDMSAAAGRIADAILRREKVAILADYDVDGACSAALLKRFFDAFGVVLEIYIPDRIFEGYGPNPEAMRELARRGATLILTADCGTNSATSIEAARDAGADVVVLDHHQVGGPLPSAKAIVNPNRDDDLSGLGYLCAAGVVFMALVATARIVREARPNLPQPDLMALLDLVAVATVCDVVPLVGLNRAFVVRGLMVAREQRNAGLAALAKTARLGEPVNVFHLGFLLGPRINAGGRIGDAALGSRLLATDDPAEAAAVAETLDRLNGERQAMERDMLAEAKAEAEAETARGQGPAVLVTASDRWHPGIVGLLASRLKDQTRRPAFAIAFDAEGVGAGSGRSIAGFDIGKLVRAAVEAGIALKGGGHAMAAGITVRRENLGALRAFFEARAQADVFRLRQGERLAVDAALSAEGATFDLVDALDKAGPFGTGHPAPVFVLPRHQLTQVRPVGVGHLRLELRSQAGGRLTAIAYRAAETPLGDFLLKHQGAHVHVAGSLSSDIWNGQRGIRFRVIDAAPA